MEHQASRVYSHFLTKNLCPLIRNSTFSLLLRPPYLEFHSSILWQFLESFSICLSETGSFHVLIGPPGVSMLLSIAEFPYAKQTLFHCMHAAWLFWFCSSICCGTCNLFLYLGSCISCCCEQRRADTSLRSWFCFSASFVPYQYCPKITTTVLFCFVFNNRCPAIMEW